MSSVQVCARDAETPEYILEGEGLGRWNMVVIGPESEGFLRRGVCSPVGSGLTSGADPMQLPIPS